MADCGWRNKASECNGYSGDADDYGGCSVATSDAWYNIKIDGDRISGERFAPSTRLMVIADVVTMRFIDTSELDAAYSSSCAAREMRTT